jgi:hypothetical protein
MVNGIGRQAMRIEPEFVATAQLIDRAQPQFGVQCVPSAERLAGASLLALAAAAAIHARIGFFQPQQQCGHTAQNQCELAGGDEPGSRPAGYTSRAEEYWKVFVQSVIWRGMCLARRAVTCTPEPDRNCP